MTSSSEAPPLVLASASPRRREILQRLGIPFSVRPVDIDESPLAGEEPRAYVERLAEAKARAASVLPEKAAGEVVLGADTIVVLDGDLLGKPRDAAEAHDMLKRLSGREHEVLTGVALLDPDRDLRLAVVESTRVSFIELSKEEIEWYVESGEPMDKAGAYAVQGLGALFVDQLTGNYSNVVGLPLPTTYRLLIRAGYPLLAKLRQLDAASLAEYAAGP